MSQTLGEKLRQAREERGISLSEVAEQTRISPHYIESIERDDYKPLPGGIFNKGFIKSFAKYVGVDEQEALNDYSLVVASNEGKADEDLKVYKPEVLTDDHSSRSMIPTGIGAVVILGLMTAGILFGLNYLNAPAETPKTPVTNTANSNSNSVVPGTSTDGSTPDMATVKIEFKAVGEPVSLAATADGKMSSNVVTPGTSALFEPKESLKLSYSRSLANNVQLTINGKSISLPAQPLIPKRNAIEFEVNKSNLAQIWTSGAISTDVPAAAPVDPGTAATTPPAATGVTPVRPTPLPKPSVAANTGTTTPAKTPEAKPAATPKPAPTTAKPAANGPN